MPGDSQAFNSIQILSLDYHLRSIGATSDSNSPAMRSWLSITSGPGQGSWHFLRWRWWWRQWLWLSISNWAGFGIPVGNTTLQMLVKTFLEKFSWGESPTLNMGSTSSWAGVFDFMKATTKGRLPVHLSASCLWGQCDEWPRISAGRPSLLLWTVCPSYNPEEACLSILSCCVRDSVAAGGKVTNTDAVLCVGCVDTGGENNKFRWQVQLCLGGWWIWAAWNRSTFTSFLFLRPIGI